jgi:NAD(P)-dependent dehydrogenase (short-subunit alcohol dehydrogenase family)
MSDALRREVAPFGVRVVVIEPGSIDTGFGDIAFGALDELDADGEWAKVLAHVRTLEAQNRRVSVEPEVVADAILGACTAEDPDPRVAVPLLAEAQIAAARVAPRALLEASMRRAMGLRPEDRTPRRSGTELALVTGAAGGIGRATAFRLAKAGYRVLATDVNARALADLAASAEEQRLSIETRRMDVTDPASITAVADEVARRTEGAGLDLLVNNAGYAEVGPVELVDEAGWRAQLGVNVYGLLAVTRAFAPAMRRGRRGRIVNVSSIVGIVSFPFLGAYCASKHAVEALTDAMRLELGAFGVGVSAIQPAFIRSGFAETAKRTLARYELQHSPYRAVAGQMDAIIDRLDRLGGEPGDVARAVQRAATSPAPKARYRTPLSAAVAARALPWLPARASDRVLGRFFETRRLSR